MGIFLGIAGMNHGFFETLQGNQPTLGLIIQAIGPAHRMWLHGSEEAFTIIPNFLLTGFLAILVGLSMIVWSISFIHKKHGPGVFFLLFILLFLFGGGIGQIVFFLPTWLASTRINQPLSWWQKFLPNKVCQVLKNFWPYTLTLASLCFFTGLSIAIFGYFPGFEDPDTILYTDWAILLAALILILFSFVSGFTDDIIRNQ